MAFGGVEIGRIIETEAAMATPMSICDRPPCVSVPPATMAPATTPSTGVRSEAAAEWLMKFEKP